MKKGPRFDKTGLLRIDNTVVTSDGKKHCLYKSNIKAVNTVFGINSIKVEIIFNDDGMGNSAYW